jgi:ASC-1-like (ASCH) protein
MIHKLKCINPYFDSIWNGSKTFEIRKNDRDYKIGDTLILRLWDNERAEGFEIVGREIKVRVIYITDYEQKTGYVVMGIKI